MRKNRVLVLMSGGVDSSTSAYLLKKEGYEVIGVTFRIWEEERGGGCCGMEGVADARRVALKLNIPFYVLNVKKEFEKEVVEYFLKEYLEGRTPNPCIRCNEKIKFGWAFQKARELEANWVATGHYAKREYDPREGRFILKKGKDKKKDQSYVLFPLSQQALRSSLFPTGNLTKGEIREIARKANLPVAEKEESQEICFIPENGYNEFIQRKVGEKLKEGPILDLEGKIRGRHGGLAFFTIGQRRGLRISGGKPLYVVSIDRGRNAIVIGEKEYLYRRSFIVREVNWISIEKCEGPLRAKVKIRYRHKESEAEIIPLGEDKVRVTFETPQRAITPGQAAVFYEGDIVLGGGWIEKVLS